MTWLAPLLLICQLTAAAPSDYRTLVDDYRQIGGPQVRELTQMNRDLAKVAVTAALQENARWTWDELRAAAILHSEVLLSLAESGDVAGSRVHLDLAERLLARVVAMAPAQDDFAWRWYQLMPHLLDQVAGRQLSAHLREYAERQWKTNAARASLVRGIEFERRGNVDGRIHRPGETALVLSSETSQSGAFASAANAFTLAIAANPSLHVARLHLGRIRMIQGQREEAAALFTAALSDVDPAVGYLAALFLGSLDERSDRFAEAEQLYRRATAAIPFGQAARLALAQLLDRTGRPVEARAVLAERLLSRIRSIEPAWSYDARAGEEVGTRFDLLRAEVWR